jgi:PPM family protein phosphatase
MSSDRFAALTDCGKVRMDNQDRYAVCAEAGIFLVADGVGGEGDGAAAARIVAERLPEALRGVSHRLPLSEVKRLVTSSVRTLHREVRFARSEGKSRSTLVLSVLREDCGFVAHLGDSRAYRWRAGSLSRLTKDHSFGQLLVDTGEMEPADLEQSPYRSQLTRCVGMDGDPEPEFRDFDWQPNDILLLCSDGLTSMLPDPNIGRIISETPDPNVSVRELVRHANDAGGADNITVITVRASKRL